VSTVVRELVATLGLQPNPGGFKAAEGLFKGLAGLAAQAAKDVEGVEGAAKKVSKGGFSGDFSDGMKSISGWAAAGATAIGVGLVAAVRSAVNDISEFNAHLSKTAPQMGLTVQSLQGWEYAAQAGGASAESFAAAAAHLREQFQHVAMGSAHATMAMAGIKRTNADGTLKNVGELMEQVSVRVMRFKDPMKQAAEATKILGQSGADLLPFLQLGPEGMRKLREEVKAFGAEVSDTDIEATKAYRLELKRLGLVALGMKQAVAGPLIDAFGKATKGFNDWVKSLGGQGMRDARAGFEQLATKLVPILTEAMKFLYKAAVFVAENISLIGIALGAVMASGITVWIVGLVATMTAGGVAAHLAWLPLIAFFTALYLAVDDVWVMLQGGDSLIGEWAPNLSKRLREFYQLFKERGWEAAFKAILVEVSGYIDDWIDEQKEKIRKFFNFLTPGGQFLDGAREWQKREDSRNKGTEMAGASAADLYSSPAYRAAIPLNNLLRVEAEKYAIAMGDNGGLQLAARQGPTASSPGAANMSLASGTRTLVKAPVTIHIEGVSDPVIAAQKSKQAWDESQDKSISDLDGG
jgi:hypothetical protein